MNDDKTLLMSSGSKFLDETKAPFSDSTKSENVFIGFFVSFMIMSTNDNDCNLIDCDTSMPDNSRDNRNQENKLQGVSGQEV